MNIQISITVWTVICFCLLMVVLRFLVFKPVLALLDSRKQRIAAAKEKLAAFQAREQEYTARWQEQQEIAQRQQHQQLKEQLQTLHHDAKLALEAAQAQRIAQVDAYREESERMQEQILHTLEEHTQELADAFAKRVIKE